MMLRVVEAPMDIYLVLGGMDPWGPSVFELLSDCTVAGSENL